MERSERETIIVLNEADKLEGFFEFGTSIEAHWQKLVRRVGGEDVLTCCKVVRGPRGEVWWRQARVPIEFLSPGTFAIGRKRQPSEAQVERFREMARKRREEVE